MAKTFETLIKEKGISSTGRWYPVSVDSFRKGFKPMSSIAEGYYPLINNLAYNLQYMEFLEKEMAELQLSDVLYTMIVKSYVITGCGIIEGIFSYIIKSHGWEKRNDEEEVLSSQAQQKNREGDTLVIRTVISKKVTPEPAKMTFDEMIKCLNHHHKALKIDHLLYPQINRIRDLRNRVHLQKSSSNTDHDYNSFNYKVKNDMQNILYNILCSSSVTDSSAIRNYDFLKPVSDVE